MLIFIPTNDMNAVYLQAGFSFKPLVIEAYQYHLGLAPTSAALEKTQNLFSKKVNTGTVATNNGNAREV